MTAPSHHHIAAFEIAMDNVMFVGVRNSVGDLDTVGHYKIEGKSNIGRNYIRENLSLDELHDNAGLARFFNYIFDLTNIGMVQRGSNSGFGIELPAGGLVGNRFFANQFDGDDALECRVPSTVNHAHSADRHQLPKLIAAEVPARFWSIPRQSGRC